MKNNNYYALEDVVATILHVRFIKKEDIKNILSVWGHTNGDSKKESGTELHMGIVLEMKAGGYLYLTGWNDYTGWGCQDGTKAYYEDNWYSLDNVKCSAKELQTEEGFEEIEWEDNPVDANKWLSGETKIDEDYII